jgi:hypothetical protein
MVARKPIIVPFFFGQIGNLTEKSFLRKLFSYGIAINTNYLLICLGDNEDDNFDTNKRFRCLTNVAPLDIIEILENIINQYQIIPLVLSQVNSVWRELIKKQASNLLKQNFSKRKKN